MHSILCVYACNRGCEDNKKHCAKELFLQPILSFKQKFQKVWRRVLICTHIKLETINFHKIQNSIRFSREESYYLLWCRTQKRMIFLIVANYIAFNWQLTPKHQNCWKKYKYQYNITNIQDIVFSIFEKWVIRSYKRRLWSYKLLHFYLFFRKSSKLIHKHTDFAKINSSIWYTQKLLNLKTWSASNQGYFLWNCLFQCNPR